MGRSRIKKGCSHCFPAALLVLCIWVFSSCEELPLLQEIKYYTAEIGPAGGYIFYRGSDLILEAAPYGWYDGGEDPTAEWGTYGYYTGAHGTDIGGGPYETQLIVDTLNDLGENGKAAQLCTNYSVENDGVTYDDWYLPKEGELNEMHENLYKEGRGNLNTGNYWSSREVDIHTANAQPFGGSYTQEFLPKNTACYVRPVRIVK